MSVDQFISHILNINKNDILQLDSLPQPDDSLIIKLKLQDKRFPCPVCGRSPIVHGYTLKKLIHSTFSNRKCFIYYYQRRYKCVSCELTYSEPNPFSKVGENLTHETKLNILKALKDIGITYTQVAKQYNVSVTEVIKIFDKHVNIHRKPLPSVLAIDEHYFPHTDFSAAKYCCVLMNFFTGELIDVLPDRRKAYLSRYFTSIKLNTSDYVLNISELDNVKYISMDLSYNFKDIASRYFPHALVCADSFHVIRHLTEAFKKIRLRCMRTTQNAALLYLLGKFKFVFRHGAHLDNEPRYNKSLGKYANLRDIRNFLFENFPDLARAYNLKEYYIHFNSSNTISSAPTALTSVIEAFAASGIPEYDDFFTMLVNWRQEIINSFTVVQGKRINNSYIESKNNLIKRLQSNANGFRNFSRARKRILYCINKYDSFSL